MEAKINIVKKEDQCSKVEQKTQRVYLELPKSGAPHEIGIEILLMFDEQITM